MKTMLQVQQEYFDAVFKHFKFDIRNTAYALNISRASVYRYMHKGIHRKLNDKPRKIKSF